MHDLIEIIGAAIGTAVPVDAMSPQAGDVARTGGDVSLAATVLGWKPEVTIVDGVARQVAWHLGRNS